MHVGRDENEVEDFCLLAKEEMESVMSRIDRSGEGVCVQASTLGSLEALLDFLKTPEVAIVILWITKGRSGAMLISLFDAAGWNSCVCH